LQKQNVLLALDFWKTAPSPLQEIGHLLFEAPAPRLYLKRDDLLHPEVSGNKWRKLKYNFAEAQRTGFRTILTFGGAYSNHIAATAAAGKHLNIKTIGIIRGQELTAQANPTLALAHANGMKLVFVSRAAYQDKAQLAEQYGTDCYVLPEGGSNALATNGVAEAVTEINAQLGFAPTYLTTALGTGGTFAGLCRGAATSDTRVLGFAALKNAQYLLSDIRQWTNFDEQKHAVFWDACGNGYGKTTPELRAFMQYFEEKTSILLDPVYTAKMLFALWKLIEAGQYFKTTDTIVALHTGGLQGRTERLIFGLNSTYKS
jgi:1-aminocyclopropane-1-carboxylate deaminase